MSPSFTAASDSPQTSRQKRSAEDPGEEMEESCTAAETEVDARGGDDAMQETKRPRTGDSAGKLHYH